MKYSYLCGAVTALAVSMSASGAFAQERWPRWYVGLTGEINFRDEADISGSATGEVSFDNSYGFGGQLGYRPGFSQQPLNWLRIEAEIMHRDQDIDQTLVNGITAEGSGTSDSMAYMLNAYLDANDTNTWIPYIGAGVGFAEVKLSASSNVGNTTTRDTVFAYQFMGGMQYAPETMPHTRFGLGYRYFATQDPGYDTTTTDVEVENVSHGIELNAKFLF